LVATAWLPQLGCYSLVAIHGLPLPWPGIKETKIKGTNKQQDNGTNKQNRQRYNINNLSSIYK